METKCIMKVQERDMDLLFMQSFSTDPGFVEIFISKTAIAGTTYQVKSVELSKRDTDFGESDITVILQLENQKHALLIEDKIDAIDMPQQKERYFKRGDKGMQNGDYDSYDVFIVCPEKYRNSNAAAKEYDSYVAYEEIYAYFKAVDSAESARVQQMKQALEKAKKQSQVQIHEIAVDSFKKYAAFQRQYYPSLDLRNRVQSGKVNGWWPHFAASAPFTYISHKTPDGQVDLKFSGKADRKDVLEKIAKNLIENGLDNIQAVATEKSCSLRIKVPVIHMYEKFEDWNTDDLRKCFDAILQLTKIAEQINLILQLYDR